MKEKEENKLSRKEKKELKKQRKAQKGKNENARGIALLVVLSLIAVALLVWCIDSSSAPAVQSDISSTSQTNLPVSTTVPVAPTVTTETPETTTGDKPTAPDVSTPTTEPAKKPDVTDEKAEILKVVTDSVNLLKSENASFIGNKTQVLDMELTECSAPAFVGIVNGIIGLFTETEIYEFDFTNGKGYDPENKVDTTTMETFPPSGKAFSLETEGVSKAYITEKDGNKIYTVELIGEKSTLENPEPKHHASACDTLNVSMFNLPMGEITKADLEYPGATVSVTIDPNGKVVGYYERLDIVGTGEAAALGMSGGGTVVGFVDETWVITWK